jgi:hypothetical protein
MAKPVLVIFQRLGAVSTELLKHPAVEIVLPDVVAVFGKLDGQSFALLEPEVARRLLTTDDDEHPEAVREVIALRTLGPSFSLENVSAAVVPGLPVFTNEEDDHVASLLLAPQLCRALCAHVQPKVKTLLAVFPAETRVLWSPIDTPEMEETLRGLCTKARDLEEDFLSGEVVRFDGERWVPTTQLLPV